MDWITKWVAVGNIDDAMHPEVLKTEGITAILSLIGFPTFFPSDGFAWHSVELIDGPGNPMADIWQALHILEDLQKTHRVLVHCSEGRSRSPFIIGCYLAWKNGLALDQAVAQVRRCHPDTAIDENLMDMFPSSSVCET